NVNGDVFFNRDQVNLSNVTGQVSGGTVRAQGTGLLERGGLQSMNIHIDADNGRFRYHEGLGTVGDGSLDVGGIWASRRLEGRLRIVPVVHIEAELQVRDYRVILTVAGRGYQLRLNMRSDPPLPELEIVSLIAGGRTREEIANIRPGSPPTSEQLFQSGAASI